MYSRIYFIFKKYTKKTQTIGSLILETLLFIVIIITPLKTQATRNQSFSEILNDQYYNKKTTLACITTTGATTLTTALLTALLSYLLHPSPEEWPIVLSIDAMAIILAFSYEFWISDACYDHPSNNLNTLITTFKDTCLSTHDPENFYHCLNQWLKHSTTNAYDPILWPQLTTLINHYLPQKKSPFLHFTILDAAVMLQNQELIESCIAHDITFSQTAQQFLEGLP
jgi:hypothetical protein